MSLYKQGMSKANALDYQGAIDAYTAVIGMSETPGDLRATALYNRALIHSAIEDESKAIVDLERVLSMNETLGEIKNQARRRLLRMKLRTEKAKALDQNEIQAETPTNGTRKIQ